MAGSLTTAGADKVMDAYFNGATWATIANVWVALFTVAPTDAGGGTEVTGGSYARVSTAPADWTASSSGALDNGTVLTFPAPTANWGTVVAGAIMSASTAGTMWWWFDLTTARTINNGDGAPSFAIGVLDFTLT